MAAFPDRVDHRRRQRRTLAAVAAAIVAAVIVTLPTVGADRRAGPPAEQQGDEVRTVTPTGTTAVELGGKPLRLAAVRGSVWAALDDGGVVRVDPASGQASTVAELPSSMFDIEVARRWVWVSQPFDKRVQAIDPETGRVVHTVTTGSPGPRGMQLVGDSLWFAAGAELFEVDADTGQVRRTLALPGVTLPYDVAVTGDAAWVTDSRGTSVTRLPLSGGPAQQVPVGTGSTRSRRGRRRDLGGPGRHRQPHPAGPGHRRRPLPPLTAGARPRPQRDRLLGVGGRPGCRPGRVVRRGLRAADPTLGGR